MGKKPSTTPEVMRNVPRSKVVKATPTVGGSLWADDVGEMQMVGLDSTAHSKMGSVSSTAPLKP